MVRQFLVKAKSGNAADGDVDVGLARQLAVMHDAAKQAREHQTNRHLRIDAGPTIVEAIAVSDLIAQPRQVENTIDAHEHKFVRNELSQRTVE